MITISKMDKQITPAANVLYMCCPVTQSSQPLNRRTIEKLSYHVIFEES